MMKVKTGKIVRDVGRGEKEKGERMRDVENVG